LAYFGQHSTAELDLELTPIEFMVSQFPNESGTALRNHLAKTSIVGTVADTRMMSLSYSQRSCIIFAKLTYICPHLLILDEPTNFLDLESVDSLISACNKYKGALLLVSHNRDFLRKCAKQFLSIVPGHFNLYDDLKTAERATYTFINEMEEGGKVGADALSRVPGGGSVASSQVSGGSAAASLANKPVAAMVDGVKTLSLSSSGSSSTSIARPTTAKVAAPVYKANDKVLAQWTDGKFYPAQVKAVKPDGKYTILYTQYGNTATVGASAIKPVTAAAAPAKK